MAVDVRNWLVEFVSKNPAGCDIAAIRRAFRETDFDFSSTSLLPIVHELCGTRKGVKDCGPQRLHIISYGKRRNARGQIVTGGKPTPIFVAGPGENAPLPPLSKSAEYQRIRYANQRNIDLVHRDKVEKERRRALKRKPAMDMLTAALFGMVRSK